MSEDLIKSIADALTQPGKGNADRLKQIREAMEKAEALDHPPEDPFRAIRNRAIEIRDLDGLATFVTVGVILERIESGWIPGLTSLTPEEGRALDHVLRIWEHEVRRRLRAAVEHYGDQQEQEAIIEHERSVLHSEHPWTTLGDMTKAQNAYRDRLKLPLHPHGECCTHYEEAADVAMGATATLDRPHRTRE